MNTEQTIKILAEQFNGNHWQKGDHNRVYFNSWDIAKHQGLQWSGYNSGNIRSASLDGSKISNSEARRILNGFARKIWYDLNSGEFHTDGENDYPGSREMYEEFVADVLAAIE
jgi:hypothetical protein